MHSVRKSLSIGLAGHAAFAAMMALTGGIARAQTITPFVDSLNASSISSVIGNPGGFTANRTTGTTNSTVYETNTITTTGGDSVNGIYTSASHQWISINNSYVPAGMTAPGQTGTSAEPAASFTEYSFQTAANAVNSDGKAGEAGNRGKFLYTDFIHSQPSQAAGTIYGVQSVLLVSPLITVQNGSVISFFAKGSIQQSGGVGGDRLLLLFSSSSASTFNIGGYTPVGGTTGPTGGHATYDRGDFTKQLIDINPNYLPDGTSPVSTGTTTAANSFPTTWTRYDITMSGLATSTSNPRGTVTGRFAFQYLVEHANPNPADGYGNDIGIDNFTVNLPEPTSIALLAIFGLPLAGRVTRRRR